MTFHFSFDMRGGIKTEKGKTKFDIKYIWNPCEGFWKATITETFKRDFGLKEGNEQPWINMNDYYNGMAFFNLWFCRARFNLLKSWAEQTAREISAVSHIILAF